MGKVMAQAVTIRPAIDQRTGVPRPRPPPSIEPVATWVVDSAKPRWLAESRMTAAEPPRRDMPWRRGDVDQALAQGADDPPAAEVGAERDAPSRR